MKLKNLKDFNPKKVAQIETDMWKAYYRHNFFKLFILLLRLIYEQFQLNHFYTLRISYYSATSVINFRRNRGKENKNIILRKLVKVFKSVSDNVINEFDYKKSAELELEWWLVDRYPERYQVGRRDALKKAMASIYNVDPEGLTEYAEYRAQAMELQDEAEKENKEADWDEVQSLLLISYKSLYRSINL